MAEERMLNDEILLGLIKANSGGGGGGTTDYDDLSNKPQIGGVTLSGNKSASDLGLADDTTVQGILDGQTIDSFGDVETALEGKQNALTAGNYMSIANDGTISVTQSIGVYDVYSYVVAGRAGNNYYYVDIQKYKNGVLQSNTRYVNDQCYDKKIIDDRFSLQYSVGGDFSWHFVLLTDSNEHKEGESIVWRYNVTKDFTETFNVSQDESTDLATQGYVDTALSGKQNTLTFDSVPTDGSTNPVESNGIYDALASKADADDLGDISTLTTTDKRDAVHAINELNSNFIGLDVDINAPDRKNLLPMTLDGIKAINSGGTWTDNVFVYKGVTYTVNLDASGNVTSITAEGTADASGSTCALCSQSTSYIRQELNGKTLTYSGCPSGGSEQTYNLYGWKVTTGETGIRDTGNGVTFNAINMNSSFNFAVIIGASYAIPEGGITFYPMLRLSTISDSTFAPYIPSVESRIEAVESLFVPKNKLLSTDNLNTIIKPQSYYWRSTDEPLNSPGKNSYMLVIKHSADTDIIRYIQIVYSFNNDKLYFRRTINGGSNWGGWYTFDMTAVV